MNHLIDLDADKILIELGVALAGSESSETESFQSVRIVANLLHHADLSDAQVNLRNLKGFYHGLGSKYLSQVLPKIRTVICAIDQSKIPDSSGRDLQAILVAGIIKVLGTSNAIASFVAALVIKKGISVICNT